MSEHGHLHFLRISRDGLQEEHCAQAAELPADIAIRESYKFSDGDEEAEYVVWDIEMSHSDIGTDSLHKKISLVPMFSRELH